MRTAGSWLRQATASVRVRVVLATTTIFAIVLVAGSMWLLHVAESRLTNQARSNTESAVQAQAQRVLVTGVAGVATSAQRADEPNVMYSKQLAPPLVTPDGIMVVTYRTADGTTGVAGTTAAATPALDATTDTFVASGTAGEALPLDLQTATEIGLANGGGPYLVSTLTVNDQVSLAAVSSLSEVENTIESMRELLWWVVPALVLLVGGLAWFVVGRALRPVHAVTHRLASIGQDSLHERVPVPQVADEVGELATTMNSMLDRLESATLVSRQLVSDASHELRTPIAVLRTELEVARRSRGTDWDAASAGMLQEVDRLQGLVDDLLLLARVGERGMRPEVLDLDDVVRDVASRRRRVPVGADDDGPSGGTVLADRVALQRALDHLVANAARHATTEVRVSTEITDGSAVVYVDDDGPGIPADERAHVVERFVRLDEGRTRDAGGSGLGLAVVADVATAHGGTLTIGDSPMGGARLALSLPAPVPELAPA
jgi:signal transduction histidine kinase